MSLRTRSSVPSSNAADLHPCLVVAEVAQAHDGSLGTAHAFIDAAKRAGADAIKFQTHIADAESTPSEPWRVRFSPQDETRYDYWKRMEFSEVQWQGLRDHAVDQGLIFISSPFSEAAVDLLDRIGVEVWKVASGEVTNTSLLQRIAREGHSVILSTGMSTFAELDAAVGLVQRSGAGLTLLQCTTAYPCPPERLGLNLLEELRGRYEVPVGLSDHTGTIFGGLAGAALGIAMLEVHVTFSRECFGPDVPASVTFEELRLMIEGIRFIETAMAHPVAKDEMADELAPLKSLFARSIVARRDLEVGHVLTADDLVMKKPGSGIPPDRVDQVVGRKLVSTVSADDLILESDLESPDEA
jgi:N-acetylneuraminate synthase